MTKNHRTVARPVRGRRLELFQPNENDCSGGTPWPPPLRLNQRGGEKTEAATKCRPYSLFEKLKHLGAFAQGFRAKMTA